MTASSTGHDGWSAQQARELFFANLRSLHIDSELERAVRQAEQERAADGAASGKPRAAGRSRRPQEPTER